MKNLKKLAKKLNGNLYDFCDFREKTSNQKNTLNILAFKIAINIKKMMNGGVKSYKNSSSQKKESLDLKKIKFKANLSDLNLIFILIEKEKKM